MVHLYDTCQSTSKSRISTGKLSVMQTGVFGRLPEHSRPPSPRSRNVHCSHSMSTSTSYKQKPDTDCVFEVSSKFIARKCKAIASKLRGKAGRQRAPQPTPGEEKHTWAKNLLLDSDNSNSIVPFPSPHPPWSEPSVANRCQANGSRCANAFASFA